MNALHTLRLKRALPLLVFATYGLLLAFSVFYLHQLQLNTIEQNALENARQLLANIELRIETLARHQQQQLIAEEITEHGVSTPVNALALIDDNGKIIQATQLGWINQAYEQQLPHFNRERIAQVLKGQSSFIEFSADKQHILGYQPVVLALQKDQIRPTKIGVLLLDYDVTREQDASWNTLIQSIYPILIIGVLLMLATSTVIDLWVEKPIRHLTEVVSQFAKGNYAVSTQLSGSGEFMVLAQVWNQMSQKLAETIQQLEVSKQHYAVTLLSIGDAVIATDTHNRITFMNKMAENLTGCSLSEALGAPLEFAFKPLDAQTEQPAESPVQAVLANGTLFSPGRPTLLKNKQGHTYQISNSAAPISTQDNEIVGVVLVFRDISDEYALRESLDTERALLKSLIDAVPDLISYKDRSSRYLGCNQAFSEFTHQPEASLIGQSDFELFSPTEADFFHSKDLEILNCTQQLSIEEASIANQDGRMVTFDTIKTPVYTPDGKLLGLVAISRDISDRKRIQQKLLESEERIRSLGDNLPNGYIYQYSMDRDGIPHFDFISAGVESLHQISRETLLTSPMSLLNQIDAEHWPLYQAAVKRSAAELSDFSMELLFHVAQGKALWLKVNSRPKRVEKLIIWDGIAIDITDKKIK